MGVRAWLLRLWLACPRYLVYFSPSLRTTAMRQYLTLHQPACNGIPRRRPVFSNVNQKSILEILQETRILRKFVHGTAWQASLTGWCLCGHDCRCRTNMQFGLLTTALMRFQIERTCLRIPYRRTAGRLALANPDHPDIFP